MMCLVRADRHNDMGMLETEARNILLSAQTAMIALHGRSDFGMIFSNLQQHAKVVAPSRSRQILDSRCDCAGIRKSCWLTQAEKRLREDDRDLPI